MVFGDIGTSPLYTLQMAGAETRGPDDILGVLSPIFWGMTVVIAVKYLTFIMRADEPRRGRHPHAARAAPESARRIDWITVMVVAGAAAVRRRHHHAGDLV